MKIAIIGGTGGIEKRFARFSEKSVAVLGPQGTWSHQAALNYNSELQPVFFDSIPETLQAVVSGKILKGIVPFENSLQGTIVQTLDGISEKRLFIHKEIILNIQHCIAGVDKDIKVNEVKKIYSHEQALLQCKEYLKNIYSSAKLILTPSTAAAFRKIKDEGLTNALAIGPRLSAEIYGLQILKEAIQDKENNQTSFVVVSKKPSTEQGIKTMLLIDPRQDRVGLLLEILEVFKQRNINLSKIESRPSREKLGSYIFYVVLDIGAGAILTETMRSLEQKNMNVVSLGSY